MKHGTNSRRGRSRGNGKRHPSSKNQSFESNGPDVKVRGSAQQVLEKYLSLARDASSSGDRVTAESYLQFAEHYYRVLTASQGGNQGGGRHNRPASVALDGEVPPLEPEEVIEAPRRGGKDQTGEAKEAKPEKVAETKEPEPEAIPA